MDLLADDAEGIRRPARRRVLFTQSPAWRRSAARGRRATRHLLELLCSSQDFG